jgi:hypothetical protein
MRVERRKAFEGDLGQTNDSANWNLGISLYVASGGRSSGWDSLRRRLRRGVYKGSSRGSFFGPS